MIGIAQSRNPASFVEFSAYRIVADLRVAIIAKKDAEWRHLRLLQSNASGDQLTEAVKQWVEANTKVNQLWRDLVRLLAAPQVPK